MNYIIIKFLLSIFHVFISFLKNMFDNKEKIIVIVLQCIKTGQLFLSVFFLININFFSINKVHRFCCDTPEKNCPPVCKHSLHLFFVFYKLQSSFLPLIKFDDNDKITLFSVLQLGENRNE